jgi:hypothetical protein
MVGFVFVTLVTFAGDFYHGTIGEPTLTLQALRNKSAGVKGSGWAFL